MLAREQAEEEGDVRDKVVERVRYQPGDAEQVRVAVDLGNDADQPAVDQPPQLQRLDLFDPAGNDPEIEVGAPFSDRRTRGLHWTSVSQGPRSPGTFAGGSYGTPNAAVWPAETGEWPIRPSVP